MSWGEEQQKEIETIRERKFSVKLAAADCDRLAIKCGEHGLTIGELIENFVGDLVGGTYSNGSDERDYADQWFERCWFGMFPEPTLLNHLLNLGYEPEHYLDMLENVETIKSDIEITKQNIAEPSDEWKDIVYHKYNDDFTSYECVPCYKSVDEYIASEKEDLESYKADLEEALEELKDMRADWKPEKEPNMNEEIELIKKWVKEREDFINPSSSPAADSYKSARGRPCTDTRNRRAVCKEPTAIYHRSPHTVEHCQSGRTERDISRAEKARQQSEPDSQEAE